MTFEFEKQNIKDVILIKPKVFTDERGFFMETYKKSVFVANNIEIDFVQDNHSKSGKNVLRGLHFQHSPFEQAKLVRCVKGKIYDVAVDIRPNSSTFKKYVRVELSEENKNMLFIPSGFAHGFVSLEDCSIVNYAQTTCYAKENDCGIDAISIGFDWGIENPIRSGRDLTFEKLYDFNSPF